MRAPVCGAPEVFSSMHSKGYVFLYTGEGTEEVLEGLNVWGTRAEKINSMKTAPNIREVVFGRRAV